MTQSISFIHAADLHLDSPFKGISSIPDSLFQTVRESTFQAFNRLIHYAIEKEVDFVLLVGDLFDEDNQSLKAQLHIRDQFKKLQSHGIDVFLSYGNHDYIKGNKYPITYPENVHIFPDEEVTYFPYKRNGEIISHIYGFSYVERQVKENKAKQFKISDRTVPFHIATLHGTLHGSQGHDPYAPFQLEDLLKESFDYWALGHIHKRQEISTTPPIIYPGNIQGRHRKETGDKGCYYVTISPAQTTYQFLPLQEVMFIELKIDLRNCESITDIETVIDEKVSELKGTKQLLFIEFECTQKQYESLDLTKRLGQLIEVLNTRFIAEAPWQYIYRYHCTIEAEEQFQVDSLLLKELKHVSTALSVEEVLKDLYTHPLAKSLNKNVSKTKLITEALNLIQKELYDEKR